MIKIIKLYIEGHNYGHDLFELIRTFFKGKEIKFLDKVDLDRNKGYLIISKLTNNKEKPVACATIYYNNIIMEEIKEDLESINIHSYNKKQIEKLAIKKVVYRSLSKYLNIILPWGILTGIRPVKVVHTLIDMKFSNEKVLNILENEYKFTSSKALLIVNIALSQRKHLYPRDKEKFSLYINIPFCPSKCSYCSFPSFKIEGNEAIVEKYIDTLILEIESTKDTFKNRKLNTIYIGGGTPTSLEIHQLERIIDKIKTIFPNRVKEFTVEAGRPDTINEEKLEMLKSYGVNRISINPQTFNYKTLERIGRNHNIHSIKESYILAKKVDFDIINMDIILGLPGENTREFKNTLKEIKSLDPDNLTVHILSLKKGSQLYKKSIKDLEDNKNIEKMVEITSEYATKEGLIPYYMYRQKQILGNLENIGYTKPSKECIYNISMMEEKETIIGFGLGAVTKIYYPKKDRIRRVPNFKSLHDYINRVSEIIYKKNNMKFH
ncbi:MAG: coproporphyrinogen dehydrogenase HemZ [Tissierella sp.]|uniref:coproporphyrinogen dehydrogenase HemZ n=1 Tax=Tissierella sp. TaxID=41274 RepID=UPI003F972903